MFGIGQRKEIEMLKMDIDYYKAEVKNLRKGSWKIRDNVESLKSEIKTLIPHMPDSFWSYQAEVSIDGQTYMVKSPEAIKLSDVGRIVHAKNESSYYLNSRLYTPWRFSFFGSSSTRPEVIYEGDTIKFENQWYKVTPVAKPAPKKTTTRSKR